MNITNLNFLYNIEINNVNEIYVFNIDVIFLKYN